MHELKPYSVQLLKTPLNLRDTVPTNQLPYPHMGGYTRITL